MRIAVLSSSFPESPDDPSAAAGLFVYDFCLELARAHHDVTVVTQAKSVESPSISQEFKVRRYPWLGNETGLSYLKLYKPLDVLSMISLFRSGHRELFTLHEAAPFDHVLAMWAVPAGLLARSLKRRQGVPYSVWCLGSDIWSYGRYPVLKHIVADVLRKADHVFADGLALGERVHELSGVPCPFLPSSRKLTGVPEPLSSKTSPRFLFVGRYAAVKGVDILLEAMSIYKERGGTGFLQLFGGGPMESAIRERASRKDLAHCVGVGGFADQATYISELAACDCFVIPSRMESIPVVLSDALQMGKPMIVSDVGDMGRLLRETPAGIVVAKEDPAALAEALQQMTQASPKSFDAAVQKLSARFDLTNSVRTWIDAIS